jgi:hypothetical protein
LYKSISIVYEIKFFYFKKLEKMGIRGAALIWFGNYLAGRTQFVDIDGNRSLIRGP